jgi:hypothetical protein
VRCCVNELQRSYILFRRNVYITTCNIPHQPRLSNLPQLNLTQKRYSPYIPFHPPPLPPSLPSPREPFPFHQRLTHSLTPHIHLAPQKPLTSTHFHQPTAGFSYSSVSTKQEKRALLLSSIYTSCAYYTKFTDINEMGVARARSREAVGEVNNKYFKDGYRRMKPSREVTKYISEALLLILHTPPTSLNPQPLGYTPLLAQRVEMYISC